MADRQKDRRNMKHIALSESTRPAAAPMNLDVGRVEPHEAARLLLLTLGCLSVSPVGALVALVAAPSGYDDWSIIRVIFCIFGSLVAGLSLASAITVWVLMRRDWLEYRQRLTDWHYAALEAFERSGGVEQRREIAAWELSASQPLHVLAAALSVQRRIAAGENNPFSVRSLEGPCFLGGVRLGDIQAAEAERISKIFADIGLIQGRGERKAGKWAAAGADEVLELVAGNWQKVKAQ